MPVRHLCTGADLTGATTVEATRDLEDVATIRSIAETSSEKERGSVPPASLQPPPPPPPPPLAAQPQPHGQEAAKAPITADSNGNATQRGGDAHVDAALTKRNGADAQSLDALSASANGGCASSSSGSGNGGNGSSSRGSSRDVGGGDNDGSGMISEAGTSMTNLVAAGSSAFIAASTTSAISATSFLKDDMPPPGSFSASEQAPDAAASAAPASAPTRPRLSFSWPSAAEVYPLLPPSFESAVAAVNSSQSDAHRRDKFGMAFERSEPSQSNAAVSSDASRLRRSQREQRVVAVGLWRQLL
eukprot:6178304-Pleurochrysis_carterae.AAC.1